MIKWESTLIRSKKTGLLFLVSLLFFITFFLCLILCNAEKFPFKTYANFQLLNVLFLLCAVDRRSVLRKQLEMSDNILENCCKYVLKDPLRVISEEMSINLLLLNFAKEPRNSLFTALHLSTCYHERSFEFVIYTILLNFIWWRRNIKLEYYIYGK